MIIDRLVALFSFRVMIALILFGLFMIFFDGKRLENNQMIKEKKLITVIGKLYIGLSIIIYFGLRFLA